jgi:RsiW-degrading membrane proteinase PrsW (M82 family)
MGVFLSLFFGFVPMLVYAFLIYRMDRYEKEPKRLLRNVFLWGAIIAAGGAFFINTVMGISIYAVTGSETATDFTTSTVIAPLVEESLKGLAVLLVFLLMRNEFDSILDGIIYAAITALGFAATENAYYIYTYGYQETGISGIFEMTFIRVIVVGWQHPFYTSFIGIGLAIARGSRSSLTKLIMPLLGWGVAVFTHAFHNALASSNEGVLCIFGTFLDWSGWIAMLVFLFVLVNRERRIMVQNLAEEIQLGIITLEQYQIACSPVRQNRTRLMAWRGKNRKDVDHFFDLCGELAHKKNQYVILGDEGGNLATIERIRTEISALSPVIY